MKSRAAMRFLSIIVICTFLPNGMVWGALQPPLGKITNPVFGTSGGTVSATVPPHLAPYVKDVTAAIQLGKALFWDMQVGSDGATACATCHYRAGADPVIGTLPKDTAKRDKNQLNPGKQDTIFGNNSTVIINFNPNAALDPVTLKPVPIPLRAGNYQPRFAPNYLLQPTAVDFPLFRVLPATSRLVIDPLTGVISDAVTSLRDTNDVIGSQGVKLADFLNINEGSAADAGTPIADQLFHISITTPNVDPANNVRRVTGRNSPSVINAVFNYTNFWDGRANNIFNGVSAFGPLDQTAGIYIDNGGGAPLVKQAVAIPNSSLASQATGPPLDHTEMSFNGRTFPELGRKMLSLTPLALQQVHPDDSVLGTPLANVGQGLNTNYSNMIKAAFQDNLTGNNTVNLPTKAFPGGEPFKQIEANFSLFWGLAIQLYEATLVSDRTPFDRFRLGNQNALGQNLPNLPSAVRGFNDFDSKCTVCHSGSEFSSAVVGSNIPNCLAPDCNRVAFTNNSTHNLIRQDVNPETFADPKLIDAGFFNIGVRPTADDPGRGGNAPSGLPLSFSRLAKETGLPFVTPKLPLPLPDKVQGSFKTPGLRNVELTAPYFHNGDALTLDQVVEFYTRGGNFPGNPELAANMQPIGNLRGDAARRADIVAFMKTLTDERVRNETAPFDHPQLIIPNGDLPLITLDATGGGPAAVPPVNLTMNPVTSPTILTTLPLSGTVDDTATVAVDVINTTTGVTMPTAAAIVGGIVGGVAQLPTDWSINLAGLTPGLNTITVTATSDTGGIKTLPPEVILVTPTATISGTPAREGTKANSATLTIGGLGVVSYQYSVDGGAFNGVDIPVAQKIVLTGLADGTHTVAVLGKAEGGIQQANATTDTWVVKVNPPLLILNPVPSQANRSTLTISGTVFQGSLSSVTVDTGANANIVQSISSGNSTWSCEITGLAKGVNNITLTALDNVFNSDSISASITIVTPDGKIKGTGAVDISDALKALQIVAGIITPTTDDLFHGDVAPLVNGIPAPDDKIDVGDAVVILKKAVGLVNF